jgi:hypothetical protein
MKMPVAYLDVAARYVELAPHLIFRTPTVANLGSPVGLYLEQPWVGLTDDDLLQIRESVQIVEGQSPLQSLTKAIEAKLKEKNT